MIAAEDSQAGYQNRLWQRMSLIPHFSVQLSVYAQCNSWGLWENSALRLEFETLFPYDLPCLLGNGAPSSSFS